jgi:hypothetical protein
LWNCHLAVCYHTSIDKNLKFKALALKIALTLNKSDEVSHSHNTASGHVLTFWAFQEKGNACLVVVRFPSNNTFIKRAKLLNFVCCKCFYSFRKSFIMAGYIYPGDITHHKFYFLHCILAPYLMSFKNRCVDCDVINKYQFYTYNSLTI